MPTSTRGAPVADVVDQLLEGVDSPKSGIKSLERGKNLKNKTSVPCVNGGRNKPNESMDLDLSISGTRTSVAPLLQINEGEPTSKQSKTSEPTGNNLPTSPIHMPTRPTSDSQTERGPRQKSANAGVHREISYGRDTSLNREISRPPTVKHASCLAENSKEEMQKLVQDIMDSDVKIHEDSGYKNMRSKTNQANLSTYDDEGLDARRAIFNSDAFRTKFEEIWTHLAPDGCLKEERYTWIYKKLYWKVQECGNHKEATEMAHAEWMAESRGAETMDFDKFYLGMFNFIDIWCDQCDEASYHKYLAKFFDPILKDLKALEHQSFKLSEKPKTQRVKLEWGDFVDELHDSAVRTAQYVEEGLTSKEIYQRESTRLGIPQHARILKLLAGEPELYGLTKLDLCSLGLFTIANLMDVMRLNKNLVSVLMKNNSFASEDMEVLCQILIMHPNLTTLDISNNIPVGSKAAKALHLLLCRNPSLVHARYQVTVPSAFRQMLSSQCEVNLHKTTIARADYLMLKEAFSHMDSNGDKTVDLKELVDYFTTEDLTMTGKKSNRHICTKVISRKTDQAKKIAQEFFRSGDADKDMLLTFEELLKKFYPEITMCAINRFIQLWEDEANHKKFLTSDQIHEIFRKYDIDHDNTITLTELKQGLINERKGAMWSRYESAFKKYDLDGNEEFSLEEFTYMMTLLDNCETETRRGSVLPPGSPSSAGGRRGSVLPPFSPSERRGSGNANRRGSVNPDRRGSVNPDVQKRKSPAKDRKPSTSLPNDSFPGDASDALLSLDRMLTRDQSLSIPIA